MLPHSRIFGVTVYTAVWVTFELFESNPKIFDLVLSDAPPDKEAL